MTKRAELAGLLEHHQAKVRELLIDLDAVGQARRLFKPDIELDDIKPKPLPPLHSAYKGEVSRIVLATLRDAKRACTTQELTMHVMAERGMNTADKRLVKTVGKRVGACLRHHRAWGLIRSGSGLDDWLTWRLVDNIWCEQWQKAQSACGLWRVHAYYWVPKKKGQSLDWPQTCGPVARLERQLPGTEVLSRFDSDPGLSAEGGGSFWDRPFLLVPP